jgi:hypothetical protein
MGVIKSIFAKFSQVIKFFSGVSLSLINISLKNKKSE